MTTSELPSELDRLWPMKQTYFNARVSQVKGLTSTLTLSTMVIISVHSVGSPTRATLLTGRYHVNTGMTNVLIPGTPAGWS